MQRGGQDLQMRELLDTIRELRLTIEALRKELNAKEKQMETMQEQLNYFQKKLFGSWKPIWKTDAAACPTTLRKTPSARSAWDAGTGCSAIRRPARRPARGFTRWCR